MPLSANVRGALFMSLAMAGFLFNDTIVKVLSSDMNVGQVMILRGMVATTLITALAWHRGALRPLATIMEPMIVLRVIGEVGGTVTFLIALTHIPIANASAILQALPLAVTMGAALFLAEPVGWRRWTAIAVGFLGVMIIVRPGVAGFSAYSLLVLATVGFAALRDLATRMVRADVPSLFLSVVTSPIVALTGLVMAPLMGGFSPVEAKHAGLILFGAILLLFGYQFIIMAMREGDISFIAPFRYTNLLWAMLVGYLVFGDIPDRYMIVGAAIIVGSGLYTLYRERRKPEAEPVAAETPARHAP
ncbi:DMT family transporter [Pararhizobium haloflavum]|uniref:DMT family transporter n=1 Tax=Pararhizobium haloflavum TaxID=2037914 RepID=UPI000C17DDE7|nr:DMT family transporter [Pararhizobium haloflavum]